MNVKNVLEGIGLLVKRGKNHVSWNENPPETAAQVVAEGLAASGRGKSKAADGEKTDDTSKDAVKRPKKTVKNSAEYEEMKKKLQNLKDEERKVDQYLEYLKEQAAVYNGRQHPSPEQMAYLPNGVGNVPDQMYVKFEDITNMRAYKSETVIGIRAPSGTALDVPHPDHGMKPGERRYEMYLNSNAKETDHPGMRGSKGEPINVYLVQPRADKQGNSQDARNGPEFVSSQETPSPQRSSKNTEGEVGAKGKPESTDSQLQGSYPPPSRGHPESHMYEMPPPHVHGGDYDRHQYPPHGDPSWGPPPAPYGHGNTPPHGYYPHPSHRDHRYPGPPEQPHMEREGDPSEIRHSSDRSSREAFRPHPHHHAYHHPHEMGRTASAGGDGQRPPSPSAQQTQLLAMPIQSPSEPHFNHYTSPSGQGFTPPRGNPRERVRSGGNPEEFPMLSLPSDSSSNREYNEGGWQPPRPKISKGPQGSRP